MALERFLRSRSDVGGVDEKRLTDFFSDAVYAGGIGALREHFAARG